MSKNTLSQCVGLAYQFWLHTVPNPRFFGKGQEIIRIQVTYEFVFGKRTPTKTQYGRVKTTTPMLPGRSYFGLPGSGRGMQMYTQPGMGKGMGADGQPVAELCNIVDLGRAHCIGQ
jgi:hypothetical protein